ERGSCARRIHAPCSKPETQSVRDSRQWNWRANLLPPSGTERAENVLVRTPLLYPVGSIAKRAKRQSPHKRQSPQRTQRNTEESLGVSREPLCPSWLRLFAVYQSPNSPARATARSTAKSIPSSCAP